MTGLEPSQILSTIAVIIDVAVTEDVNIRGYTVVVFDIWNLHGHMDYNKFNHEK